MTHIFIMLVLFATGILVLVGLIKLLANGYYITTAIIVLGPFAFWETNQYLSFSKAVPEKIGLSYPIHTEEKSIIYQPCGIAVFKLSDQTIKNIEKDNLKFFAKATLGRGYSEKLYYKYEAWQHTPLPKDWISEGSWIHCDVKLNSELSLKIHKAAKTSNSFFTQSGNRRLVLMPSLGYVVYSFHD